MNDIFSTPHKISRSQFLNPTFYFRLEIHTIFLSTPQYTYQTRDGTKILCMALSIKHFQKIGTIT